MTDYQLGAQRTKIVQSKGLRAGRRVAAHGSRVPDVDYKMHALDEDGMPLCGYTGQFEELDNATWRTASATLSKCRDCVRHVAGADPST